MIISLILILSVAFVVAVVITGWDIASSVYVWQARIRIGRWDDRGRWLESVEHKARKWLHRTPTVPVTDSRRYILIDIIRGRYRSANVQAWQTAGLLLGLGEDDARKFGEDRCGMLSDDILSVDRVLLAYALKKFGALSQVDEDKVVSFLLGKLSSGTMPYSPVYPEYRYVDTIGMICPFLYAAGMSDYADRQIGEYDSALYEGVFPFHAFDSASMLPLGAHDWGRGIGWYSLGLVESGRYEDRVTSLAERMLSLQKANGSFGCFLFDRFSHKDSSATVLAGLLFTAAYRNTQDERFLDAARRAESALMAMTRRDGAVDFAQGDTMGICIYSDRFGVMPFVQGMTLYLAKELDALSKRSEK